jgi:hypothetical protein
MVHSIAEKAAYKLLMNPGELMGKSLSYKEEGSEMERGSP